LIAESDVGDDFTPTRQNGGSPVNDLDPPGIAVVAGGGVNVPPAIVSAMGIPPPIPQRSMPRPRDVGEAR
jgi:hypothetical protein